MRVMVGIIASTCPSVRLIAAYPLSNGTSSLEDPLLAFAPVDWKGNMKDVVSPDVVNNTQINGPALLRVENKEQLPSGSESLIVALQDTRLLWIIALSSPPQQLQGKGGTEEWIKTLLKAPLPRHITLNSLES